MTASACTTTGMATTRRTSPPAAAATLTTNTATKAIGVGMGEEQVARCEDCGRTYRVDEDGFPETVKPWACDDCGGYVAEVPS